MLLFIGFWEVSMILLVVLIVFGPQSLPEIARGLGSVVREFRQASDQIKNEIMNPVEEIKKMNPIEQVKNEIMTPIKEDLSVDKNLRQRSFVSEGSSSKKPTNSETQISNESEDEKTQDSDDDFEAPVSRPN